MEALAQRSGTKVGSARKKAVHAPTSSTGKANVRQFSECGQCAAGVPASLWALFLRRKAPVLYTKQVCALRGRTKIYPASDVRCEECAVQ